MDLEKKLISKPNWKRALKRKDVYMEINENSLKGEAFLIFIEKVKEVCYKKYDDTKVKIVDDGYYWLQLALKNENYWITAMFDNNKKVVQYYIDVTDKNVILKNGKSYFYDLFLDIIMLENGKIYLVDEDELQQALQEEIITKKQYNLAYETANKIKEKLQKNKEELEKICKKYFEFLIDKLNV